MADDKLKTGPEPPGPDRPGDAPVKEAPPIQEPPVQETNAPGKTQEPAAPGTGPALQAEQSVIPGMGEDNPARSALGEVVVDFDKINELMWMTEKQVRTPTARTFSGSCPIYPAAELTA